jgi:hypothetical protein
VTLALPHQQFSPQTPAVARMKAVNCQSLSSCRAQLRKFAGDCELITTMMNDRCLNLLLSFLPGLGRRCTVPILSSLKIWTVVHPTDLLTRSIPVLRYAGTVAGALSQHLLDEASSPVVSSIP